MAVWFVVFCLISGSSAFIKQIPGLNAEAARRHLEQAEGQQSHCKGPEPIVPSCEVSGEASGELSGEISGENGSKETSGESSGAKRPHFTRGSKIAIIGAGASGITMAKLLKDRGYTNVKLLEKSPRSGGYPQTLMFKGVPHELATCYTVGRYECVIRWADETYITPVPFGNAYVRTNNSDQTEFNEFWFKSLVRAGRVTPSQNVSQMMKQFGAEVYTALTRYKTLYSKFFGNGEYLFPDRLSQDNLRELNMTFGEYLDKHNLQALVPYTRIGTSAQGYGHITSLPAFYGLLWFSPNMVDYVIRQLTGAPHPHPGLQAAMLLEGWGTFMKRLSRNLDITLNATITQVQRTRKDVKIEYSVNGAATVTETFDFLIVTSRMPASLAFLDASEQEIDIFSRLKHRKLAIGTVNVTKFGDASELLYEMSALANFVPNKVSMVRNDVAMLHGSNLIPGPGAEDIRSVLSESTVEYTDAQVKADMLNNFLKMASDSNATANFISFGNYDYHSAFTQEEIQQGFPWKIWELQGAKRTWHAGSYASFESVADVLDYNYKLINSFLCY